MDGNFVIAFALFKLPSPGELAEIIRMPLDFTIKSDIFQNCNTLLAFTCLALIFRRPFPVRILIYSISFYIKSPAIPAFLMMEIYILFWGPDSPKDELSTKFIKLFIAGITFTFSFFVFFYSTTNHLSQFVAKPALVNFYIRSDIDWLSNGLLLYDAFILMFVLGSRYELNRWQIFIWGGTAILLIVYDSIGLIKINIREFRQVEFFFRFALSIIFFFETEQIKLTTYFKKGITCITIMVMIFSWFTLSHFSFSLLTSRLHRFSEYLDNRPLIKITQPISDSNDIVAYNTLDSRIRKGKQLQLCGIIKNQIWVSNLKYGSPHAHPMIKQDWITLRNALEGKKTFSVEYYLADH